MLNRAIWIMLFLAIFVIISWLEWKDSSLNTMVWFLACGFWSAVCGIGYTICDTLFKQKKPIPNEVKIDKSLPGLENNDKNNTGKASNN